jgi:hypothetical protein
MLRIIVITAVAFGLAACSPKREFEIDLDNDEKAKIALDKDGESGALQSDEATVQFGDNITNAIYPTGGDAYPGSKVVGFTRIRGGAANDEDLVMVNLEATASGGEVVEFYKKTAKNAGLIVRNESVTMDGGMVAASSEDNKMQLNVVIMREAGKSMIMVTGNVPPE